MKQTLFTQCGIFDFSKAKKTYEISCALLMLFLFALPSYAQSGKMDLRGADLNGNNKIDDDELLIISNYWGEQRDISGSTITIDLPNLADGAKPLEMVRIPAGTFIMGSPSSERSRGFYEGPQHEVTISKAFYLGKYEVTQAQWEAVVGNNPSLFSGHPNHPVEQVSWNDCQTFIAGLNELGQGTFRLPTEAEWEYACRAGTTTRYSFGDAMECDDVGRYCEIMDQYMWWLGNSTHQGNVSSTKEVGLKLPNPWGLFDMHGNIYEWCQDWYGEYSSSAQTDPAGPSSGSYRVYRGGGWSIFAQNCRSADRNWITPNFTDTYLGFRVFFSQTN